MKKWIFSLGIALSVSHSVYAESDCATAELAPQKDCSAVVLKGNKQCNDFLMPANDAYEKNGIYQLCRDNTKSKRKEVPCRSSQKRCKKVQ